MHGVALGVLGARHARQPPHAARHALRGVRHRRLGRWRSGGGDTGRNTDIEYSKSYHFSWQQIMDIESKFFFSYNVQLAYFFEIDVYEQT